MMLLLFGAVGIGRVYYTYHTLQKAMRGGAGLLARTPGVAYCDAADLTQQDVRNFIVYGNLQGQGTPIYPGLTPDMIQIVPERRQPDSTGLAQCSCAADSEDTASCDTSAGGRVPDFVAINLGSGYPLTIPFPFVNLGTMNLRVAVRMPVTGE